MVLVSTNGFFPELIIEIVVEKKLWFLNSIIFSTFIG